MRVRVLHRLRMPLRAVHSAVAVGRLRESFPDGQQKRSESVESRVELCAQTNLHSGTGTGTGTGTGSGGEQHNGTVSTAAAAPHALR
jgi:hypothetical protein